jgi:DNA primase
MLKQNKSQFSTAPAHATQPDSIEEIKQSADIFEVISEYVPLKKRGQEYIGLCPFHDETTPSFSVSPAKQLYYCHGCTAGGDSLKFLMEHLGLKFADAVEHLAQQFSIPVSIRGNQFRDLSGSLPHRQPKSPKL